MSRGVTPARYDVVIFGGGLAGLTLARHLLLETDRTVLVLERRDALPPERQKVGESLVQIGGYYLAKVLDLEEHLQRHHYMKYNLRFNWPSAGRDNRAYEDYSQATIRTFSNIASYQLDRNVLEAELLRRNLADQRFHLRLGVERIEHELAQDAGEPHRVRFRGPDGATTVRADWLVDASGRVGLLAKRRRLRQPSGVHHGSFFWWVEGLVDVERLTALPRREVLRSPARRHTGHLPAWLATNHFSKEGVWLWVIALPGKTSLGLVFDKRVLDPREVFSVEKATRWVCENFPCFAPDLPNRKVLDSAGFTDFSYDCRQTVSEERWAMTGEAGRFSDPLYSPGNDLIAIHNTLIVDAVQTDDAAELGTKCRLYEQVLRTAYQAYLPSYSVSYNTLGDPEAFSLKYAWELTVYFAGYVFPFINDLFTDRRFLLHFMRLFMRLGPLNHGVQRLLADYCEWKKTVGVGLPAEPIYFDFTSIGPLAEAQKTFLDVGVGVQEAREILAGQVANLEELARFITAHVASAVLDEPGVVENRQFVEAIDLDAIRFDPEEWRRSWEARGERPEPYPWSFDPRVTAPFRQPSRTEAARAEEATA